jgi:hypothetical protein
MEGNMESGKGNEAQHTVEREITVNGVRFRVKSVFDGKVKLGDALQNIAMKKQDVSRLPKAG